MTQKSLTMYQWKCDAIRCEEESDEQTNYTPPPGWASFTIHDADYQKTQNLHFCPSCVVDIREVKPLK